MPLPRKWAQVTQKSLARLVINSVIQSYYWLLGIASLFPIHISYWPMNLDQNWLLVTVLIWWEDERSFASNARLSKTTISPFPHPQKLQRSVVVLRPPGSLQYLLRQSRLPPLHQRVLLQPRLLHALALLSRVQGWELPILGGKLGLLRSWQRDLRRTLQI